MSDSIQQPPLPDVQRSDAWVFNESNLEAALAEWVNDLREHSAAFAEAPFSADGAADVVRTFLKSDAAKANGLVLGQ